MSAKTRLWVLGTAVLSAALILFGVVGGLLPQLSVASSTEDLVESAQIRNDAQLQQIQRLSAAKDGSGELAEAVAELQRSIPPTADTGALLRELEELATETGVQLTSVTADTPTPAAADAAATEQAAADQAAAEAASAEGDTIAEGEAAAEDAVVPATGPVSIPLTVVAAGSHEALSNFVRAVQTGSRLLLINQLDIAEADTGGSTATIVGVVFFSPQP